MIKIFSSYTRDIIFNRENKKIAIKRGGPAFFIGQVFQDSGLKYKLFRSNPDAEIKIEIKKGGEVGEITKESKNKKITGINKKDTVAISTINDEWILNNKVPIGAKVFLDVQGYVRRASKNPSIYKLAFWDDIFCIKGNDKEIKKLPKRIIQKQRKKCLIITKGKDGAVAYFKGKKYLVQNRKVSSPDTIGAGDTFFASFIVQFIKTGKLVESLKEASRKTEKFLLNKIDCHE